MNASICGISAIVCVALLGCGKGTELKTAPPPENQVGYKSVQAQDVSIFVPDGWEPGVMGGVDVLASGLTGLDEDPTNVIGCWINIEERKIPGQPRTGLLLKKIVGGGNLESATKTMGQTLMAYDTKEPVELPIGPSTEFSLTRTTRGGDRIGMLIYVVSKGKDAYNIMFVSSLDQEGIKRIGKEAIQSLRIKLDN